MSDKDNEYKEVVKAIKDEVITDVRSIVDESNKNEDLEKSIEEVRSSVNEIAEKISTNAPVAEDDDLSKRQVEAFDLYIRSGKKEDKNASEELETRALTGGSTSGGFLVPLDIEKKIDIGRKELNNMRKVVQARPTSKDVVVLGAMSDITSTWGPGTVSPQDATGDQAQVAIHKLRALVLIDHDTLDDSEADIIGTVVDLASREFAIQERDKWTVGTGVNQPVGFTTNATLQAAAIKTGTSGELGADDATKIAKLDEMIFSLEEEYAERAVFVMNRTTLGQYNSVRDANGDKIYDPATNKLMGYDVISNASMEAYNVDTNYPVAFGDFSTYRVFDRKLMTMERLEEKYVDQGKLGLLFTLREGGALGRDETGIVLLETGV